MKNYDIFLRELIWRFGIEPERANNILKYGISWCDTGINSDGEKITMCCDCKNSSMCENLFDEGMNSGNTEEEDFANDVNGKNPWL